MSLVIMLVWPICVFESVIMKMPSSSASLENITYSAPSTLMGFLHY